MKKNSFSIVPLVFALVVLVALGGYTLFVLERPAASLGASGAEQTNHFSFPASLHIGGRTASSSAVSTTFKVAEIRDVARVDFTPNLTGLTETIPASTTISQSLIPRAGDTQAILFCNATSTAGATYTLAFGTGIKNQTSTSTYAISPSTCAKVTLSRKLNSDIDAFFDLYR